MNEDANDTTEDTTVGEAPANAEDAIVAPPGDELVDQLTDAFLADIRGNVRVFVELTLGLKPAPSETRAAKAPAAPREPRELIDNDAVMAALDMVANGNAKDVSPNVLLAAKRRGFVLCLGRGRAAKYKLTDAGVDALAAGGEQGEEIAS